MDPNTAIFPPFANFLRLHRVGLKPQSVRGHDTANNFTNRRRNRIHLHVSKPQKIHILGGPGNAIIPQNKKHCSLQQEAIRMPGL